MDRHKGTGPIENGAIRYWRPLKMVPTSRFYWRERDGETAHAFSSGRWMMPARSPRDRAGRPRIGPSTINGKSVSETSSNQTASLDYRLPLMPIKTAWLITRTNHKSSMMANGLPLQMLEGGQKETGPIENGAIKCWRPLKMATTSRFCWKGMDEKTVHAFSSGQWMTPARSPRDRAGKLKIGPSTMIGRKALEMWLKWMEWLIEINKIFWSLWEKQSSLKRLDLANHLHCLLRSWKFLINPLVVVLI